VDADRDRARAVGQALDLGSAPGRAGRFEWTLLWRIQGSETVEGIYVEPNTNLSEASGSATTRNTGLRGASAAGRPPDAVDVLDRLFARWAKLFPAKPAPGDSAR